MPLTRSMTKTRGQCQSSSSLSERVTSKPRDSCTQKTTLKDEEDTNNDVGSSSAVNESCDTESWLDRADHPLLNDLVIVLVFQYVKRRDLKACRLVCKKWNILTIPHTLSKLQVNISDGRNRNPSQVLSKFVRLMKSNTLGIPFGTFKLDDFQTRTGVGKQFIKLCGTTAKKFNILTGRHQNNVENVSALLRSAPNLEYFTMPSQMCSNNNEAVNLFNDPNMKLQFLNTLNLGGDRCEHRRKVCPTFFEELLTAAQNISTFILYDEYYDKFGPANNCGSLDVLKTLEELGREPSIKNLLFIYVKIEHFEILKTMASKGLKLERLDFNIHEDVPADLFEIVNLFSDTLRTLHARSGRTTLLEFLPMPKLKLLHLNLTANSRIELNNLNSIFPVLETLHLNFGCQRHRPTNTGQQFDDLLLQDECCPNLKSLTVENVRIESETFTRMINVFPNLTHLELEISKDSTSVNIFKEIWTHMTCLEKLNIYGDIDTEESLSYLIVGVSGSDIQELGCWDRRYGLETLNFMTPEVRKNAILQKLNGIPNLKNRPSIRNLTNLKYLRLCVDRRDCWGINDMTAYFGFYLMNIRHLYVQHCMMLTHTCAEALVKELGLHSWIFLRGGEDSGRIIPPRYDLDNAKEFPRSQFRFDGIWTQYPDNIYCNRSNLDGISYPYACNL